LRLSQVWATAAVLIPVLVVTGTPLVAIDLAYQIRAGELMIHSHSLLHVDTFTVSASGRPWLNQQWGAQILLFSVFRAGGWLGLALARAALAAAVLTFVFLACREAGAATKRAAWLTLAAGVLLPAGFQLRPQIFGMACFAATAWLVAGRHRHPGRLWVVVAITALWANLHGTFFLGPLLVGVGWLEDRIRHRPSATRMLWVGTASAAATLVNPYGPRVWSYVLGLSLDPVIRKTVEEWQPPTIQTYTGVVFFLSVAIVVVLLGRRERPVPWFPLLSLGIFFAVGLAAIRGVYWWAIAAPVFLAGALGEDELAAERRDPVTPMNAVVLAALGIALASVLVPWLPYAGREAPPHRQLSFAPAGITAELHRILRPGEAIFNAQEWGSWLEFEFPDNRVVTDSRFEVIPNDVWRLNYEVSAGVAGWQRVLDGWSVDVAVLARDQQRGLIPRMKADPEWSLSYEDADGLIFTRTETG
jgi:hypothetical protein